MKANPGGQIDVSDIVGRDRLIHQIWQVLQQQSVLVTAERRIGKTCVVRDKIRHAPPPGWFPVYQDLEHVHCANDFARTVYEEVQQFLGGLKKAGNRAKQFMDQWRVRIAGAELERVSERPWKRLLTCTIQDLVEQQSPRRLVFLWDEVPYMLDNIRRREGTETAEELLDVLRALRHTFPAFRMVLTGSIGLHHVLTRLREAAYANEPTNDMYPIEVTPLAPADGEELARRLIAGESLICADVNASAAAIASQADYVPFYIHHIARCLKMSARRADPQCVAEAVAGQLVDPNDPWELAHYRDRLAGYYGERADLVRLMLDELSVADRPLGVHLLFERIKAQRPFDDRDLLLRLLRLAECDHYVSRDPDGKYSFRFPLVKRWWRLDRAL